VYCRGLRGGRGQWLCSCFVPRSTVVVSGVSGVGWPGLAVGCWPAAGGPRAHHVHQEAGGCTVEGYGVPVGGEVSGCTAVLSCAVPHRHGTGVPGVGWPRSGGLLACSRWLTAAVSPQPACRPTEQPNNHRKPTNQLMDARRTSGTLSCRRTRPRGAPPRPLRRRSAARRRRQPGRRRRRRTRRRRGSRRRPRCGV
jgi:hypothetical protein